MTMVLRWNRDLITWSTEIKLRAERRTGQLLKETAETGQRRRRGGDRKSKSRADDIDLTLAEIGLSRNQSSDCQQLAEIPEDEFEAMAIRHYPGRSCSILAQEPEHDEPQA